MELRQIVRDQKLSDFNYKLADFISEQDKIPSGKKTGDIPHFWYKNPKTGRTVSSTDQNATDRGYELATKEDLPNERKPKKVDAKGGDEVKVNISDEEKEKINNFSAEIGLKRSKADPDVFVDEDDNAIMTIGPDGTLLAVDEPGELSDKEAKKYEERINDFNAGTDDVTTAVATFMSTEKASRENELPSAEERKKLFQQDAANTDKALSFTKADVAAQKEQKGKKDVGLGTPESRAGEAVTHKAMRMLKEGKSYEEIKSELMKIAKKKDTVLKEDWVDAGLRSTRAALRAIGDGDEQRGIDNIEDIVWDTDQGREAIGVGDHGTSADMFVKTKDGKRIGISLKKDGKVFLANKGYTTEMDKFADKLRESGIPSDQIDNFMEETSIGKYDDSLRENLISSATNILKKKKLKAAFEDAIDRASQDDKKAQDQYLNRVEEAGGVDEFLKKFADDNYNADDVKALSRICQFSGDENLVVLYDGMRNEDAKMMQRMLGSFNDNPAVADGFKEFVLEGVHFESILDLDQNPELDGFLTIYGEEPDGVELSKDNLLDLFGSKTKKLYEIDEQWQQTDDPKEKEKIRKQIAKEAESKIYIDYKDGAKNGIIKVKGKDGSDYPLFTIQTRSRGIGTSPILEIAQTTFMTNSLKNGSFDADTWSPQERRTFYRNRKKELSENLKEGGLAPVTKKALKKELAAVENKLSTNESIKYFGSILDELKQNTLGYHWMKAEEDYPVDQFIREINEGSLN